MRRRAEIFREVGKFVTEEKGPGVRRHRTGGDRMNGDGAVVQAPSDPDQGAGILAVDEAPVDLAAGGLRHFAGDGLKFGKAQRLPIARIRPPTGQAAVLRAGRVDLRDGSGGAAMRSRGMLGSPRHWLAAAGCANEECDQCEVRQHGWQGTMDGTQRNQKHTEISRNGTRLKVSLQRSR